MELRRYISVRAQISRTGSTLILVANEIALLATIRTQPGGLPGERAVVGATHSSWFSFRATFSSKVPNSCASPTLCYYRLALGLISFVETRQSAFIFQAQILPDSAALRDLFARSLDGRFVSYPTN